MAKITPQNLWSEMLKFKHLLGLRHGYTIPFLVGAYYKCGFIEENELKSASCIKYVIDHILESTSSEYPIKIFNCPDVNNELILQQLANDLNAEEVKYLMSWESNIHNKLYWHHKETDVTDYDSLIAWLWDKTTTRGDIPYRELISSKRFSCDFGFWGPFNRKEEKFINNISILETVSNLNTL